MRRPARLNAIGMGLGVAAWVALAQLGNSRNPAIDLRQPDGIGRGAAGRRAWVLAEGDNQGLPFVIVDKVGGEVFVIDPSGKLLGAAPALFGLAIGDDLAAGHRRPQASRRSHLGNALRRPGASSPGWARISARARCCGSIMAPPSRSMR